MKVMQRMSRLYSTVSAVLVFLFLSACNQAGIDVTAEKAVLKEMAHELVTAEAARDLDTVMGYWADGAILQVNGAPQVEGKDSIRELMRPMLSSFKEFEGSTTHIEVASSGDLAYEYGVNRLVFPGEGPDLLAIGKYLAVWEKSEGNWRIRALSVTNDEPAPVPMEASPGGA